MFLLYCLGSCLMNRVFNQIRRGDSHLPSLFSLYWYCLFLFNFFLSVDTPFLTVLKTWTSPFEHSVIIHVCVRLGFPEVLARAPCLRIPELDRLVAGFAPNTCILLLRGRVGLVDHPHPSPAVARCHRLVFAATGNIVCRPALFVAGQHSFVPTGTPFGQDGIFCRPIAVHLLLQIFLDSCIAFAPLHTRVWRDLPLAKLVL